MLTPKAIQDRLAGLERLVKDEYKPAHPKPGREWARYERQWRRRLEGAARDLAPVVAQASRVHVERGRGAPHKVALEQRVLILLLKVLFGKSNRVMAGLLVFFGLLAGIQLSYKSVERLHSDPAVGLALENLHRLLLDRRGVDSAHVSGDGTGYGLSITRHYASTVQRQRDKAKENPVTPLVGPPAPGWKKVKRWVYVFRLLDLRTRLYVATGTSLRSERDAYDRALGYLDRLGVHVESVRLDRLYSHPRDADNFPGAAFWVLPRKGMVSLPVHHEWLAAMRSFVEDTVRHLEEYYRRQHSEVAFGADKRLLGWTLPQRREDRLDRAAQATMTWHNLLHLHGPDYPAPIPTA